MGMGNLLDWLIANAPKFGELLGSAFNSIQNLFFVTDAEGAVTGLSFFTEVLGLGIIASLISFGLRSILRAINAAKVK